MKIDCEKLAERVAELLPTIGVEVEQAGKINIAEDRWLLDGWSLRFTKTISFDEVTALVNRAINEQLS